MNFVATTRTGGLWSDVRAKLDPRLVADMAREHRQDILGVALALPAQLCFFFACMCFIARDWTHFAWSAGMVCVCAVGLYFVWYRNLKR